VKYFPEPREHYLNLHSSSEVLPVKTAFEIFLSNTIIWHVGMFLSVNFSSLL